MLMHTSELSFCKGEEGLGDRWHSAVVVNQTTELAALCEPTRAVLLGMCALSSLKQNGVTNCKGSTQQCCILQNAQLIIIRILLPWSSGIPWFE